MDKIAKQKLNNEKYIDQLRKEIAGGLLFCHSRESEATSKTLEVTAFSYALIELLMEQGIITEDDLNERKRKIAKKLVENFRESGMGILRQEHESDKYTFQKEVNIDCENRVHLCKAACCRLPFALSQQDVEEGIVKWDFETPYMIAHKPDGYCVHNENHSCSCMVYKNRPLPCRGYDCRNDKRIWNDFEKRIINPELENNFISLKV